MKETTKVAIAYRVPYADTDQMGVVYYANYLVYFERTRNELLRELGMPYIEVEASGLFFPVIEAQCSYRASAKYDDLLTLTGWFAYESKTRIKAYCEVSLEGTLLAEGFTLHACIDAQTMRPQRLPEKLFSAN